MNNINNLSSLIYNFIIKYNYEIYHQKWKLKNSIVNQELEEQIIKSLEKWFMEDSIYFILLYDDKKIAISKIKNMLKTKNGTKKLIDKLGHTFDDFDSYFSYIQEMYELTCDLLSMKELCLIVNRKFEDDQYFKERDYFNFYLDYKRISDMLFLYYKNVFS